MRPALRTLLFPWREHTPNATPRTPATVEVVPSPYSSAVLGLCTHGWTDLGAGGDSAHVLFHFRPSDIHALGPAGPDNLIVFAPRHHRTRRHLPVIHVPTCGCTATLLATTQGRWARAVLDTTSLPAPDLHTTHPHGHLAGVPLDAGAHLTLTTTGVTASPPRPDDSTARTHPVRNVAHAPSQLASR